VLCRECEQVFNNDYASTHEKRMHKSRRVSFRDFFQSFEGAKKRNISDNPNVNSYTSDVQPQVVDEGTEGLDLDPNCKNTDNLDGVTRSRSSR